MKDIIGKEIEVGSHVIYMKSLPHKQFEEAIVIESPGNFIKIEYLGISSPLKYPYMFARKKGEKSKLTVTDKKVIVLDSYIKGGTDVSKEAYKISSEGYKNAIKKLKDSLNASLKREKKLVEINDLLQAKVDKINNRFDILDL